MSGSLRGLSRDRLLIIDDDADLRSIFRDVAEAMSFQVAEADNKDEFKTQYEALKPSVILLDLNMPEVDGVEILRELAHLDCTAPVLLASGQDERVLSTVQRLGRMLGLSMQAVLQKPVAIDALEAELETTRKAGADVSAERLKKAIDDEEFILHYQPKVDLQADELFPVIGCEALVRWAHPELGLLPPAAFLPQVEENDLIGALTGSLIRQVIRQLSDWKKLGLEKPVAVNLSPKQLNDLKLPDEIAALLDEQNLAPELMVLEITEQAAMQNIQIATDILTRLRLKNIAVSLDDFGAGYSSLIELYRLPLSELKIDRSLVMELDDDRDARTVLRGIQAMATELNLPLCVEGVESMKTAAYLSSIGCAKAQGFFFSKPLPANAYYEFATYNASLA